MATYPYKIEASTRGIGMSAHNVSDTSKSQHSGDQKSKAASAPGVSSRWGSLPTDGIGTLVTNYSVAPGMAWIEMTNTNPLSAGQIKGDIPLWGSGQLLGALNLPLGCVIIKPRVMPTPAAASTPEEEQQQQQQQAEMKKQQEEQKKQAQQQLADKKKKQAQTRDDPVPEDEVETEADALLRAQLAGMAVETQARHEVDNTLTAQYQGQIQDQIPIIAAQGPLTPEEQALTGMSPQGFPGVLPGLNSASALPSGMGVQGITIDRSQTPAEVTVTLVGSGQVPAHSRWLIFTVTGV